MPIFFSAATNLEQFFITFVICLIALTGMMLLLSSIIDNLPSRIAVALGFRDPRTDDDRQVSPVDRWEALLERYPGYSDFKRRIDEYGLMCDRARVNWAGSFDQECVIKPEDTNLWDALNDINNCIQCGHNPTIDEGLSLDKDIVWLVECPKGHGVGVFARFKQHAIDAWNKANTEAN